MGWSWKKNKGNDVSRFIEDESKFVKNKVASSIPIVKLNTKWGKSKKGGFLGSMRGNSKAYENIDKCLNAIVSLTNTPLASNGNDDFQNIVKMNQYYNILLSACDEYMEKNAGAISGSGMERLALVGIIKEQALSDMKNIQAEEYGIQKGVVGGSKGGRKWDDLLREEVIAVDDFEGLKTVGEGGGLNHIINDGDKKYFFKMAENLDESAFDEKGSTQYAMAKILQNAGITIPKKGEGKVNVNKRNVAMSRMAKLLGLGHLIAESKTVKVFDKEKGQFIEGNLMEEAEGESLKDIPKLDIFKEKRSSEDAFQNIMSPGVMRDMYSLQVLDIICAQQDRHDGNIHATFDKETGKITGIKGIDNDAAFGLNKQALGGGVNARGYAANDLDVYDEQDTLTIPKLDKKLADRIMSVTESQIRYQLFDLLTEEEIDACILRLNRVKNGIKKALEAQASGGKESHTKIVEDEKEWDFETHKGAMNRRKAGGEDEIMLEKQFNYMTNVMNDERYKIQDDYAGFATSQEIFNIFKKHGDKWQEEVREKIITDRVRTASYYTRFMGNITNDNERDTNSLAAIGGRRGSQELSKEDSLRLLGKEKLEGFDIDAVKKELKEFIENKQKT